jgi:hypothetical protein
LLDMPETERAAIGACGRAAVLARHTAAHRVLELENYLAAIGAPLSLAADAAVAQGNG